MELKYYSDTTTTISMKKIFVAAGFAFCSVLLPFKALAADFSNFYIFGDSLSDTGNIFNFTQQSLPPSPPYFNGRFSNDQIWVDYLGDKLNLNPIPFSENPDFINDSVNFAVGGASSGLGNSVVPSAPLPGVLEQVSLFTQPFLTTNQQIDPNALYAVLGGGNDYLFGGNFNTEQTVQNLSTSINFLATAGAKNIILFNLPNLGATPLALATQQSQILTDLTIDHNNKLAESLSIFKSNNQEINLFDIDVFSLFSKIGNNPAEFGFSNVTTPCVVGDLTNILSVCDVGQQNEFLFFDSVHPTTNVHRLVADAAFLALEPQSVPEPGSVLGMLALGALGAAGVLKRQQKKFAFTPASPALFAQSSHTTVEN